MKWSAICGLKKISSLAGDPTAVAKGCSDCHAKQDATYRSLMANSPESSRRSYCEQTEACGLNDTPIQIPIG